MTPATRSVVFIHDHHQDIFTEISSKLLHRSIIISIIENIITVVFSFLLWFMTITKISERDSFTMILIENKPEHNGDHEVLSMIGVKKVMIIIYEEEQRERKCPVCAFSFSVQSSSSSYHQIKIKFVKLYRYYQNITTSESSYRDLWCYSTIYTYSLSSSSYVIICHHICHHHHHHLSSYFLIIIIIIIYKESSGKESALSVPFPLPLFTVIIIICHHMPSYVIIIIIIIIIICQHMSWPYLS